MLRAFIVAVAALVAVACSAAPAVTPRIIYVTPEPAEEGLVVQGPCTLSVLNPTTGETLSPPLTVRMGNAGSPDAADISYSGSGWRSIKSTVVRPSGQQDVGRMTGDIEQFGHYFEQVGMYFLRLEQSQPPCLAELAVQVLPPQ